MSTSLRKLTPLDIENETGKNSLKDQMMQIISKLYTHKNKALITMIIGGVISLIFISMLSLFHFKNKTHQVSSMEDTRSKAILLELNDINTHLKNLTTNPTNQKFNIEHIQQSIQTIQNSVTETAKTADIEKVSQQLSSVKDDLDTRMIDIKKSMSESMGNKEYLDESALPFNVVTVDVIAGQPYVSVNYANHVSPLAVSDMMAGWRLLVADFDNHSAEFVNEKNQFVKVVSK